MFLRDGYGATSIDAIAQQARISKRTFYHRFADKAALFAAVVHDLVTRLRPPDAVDDAGLAALFAGASLQTVLRRIAELALQAALRPEAIALQRMIIAEATRFPDLAAAVLAEGTRQQAVLYLAALLQREIEAGGVTFDQPHFAAEQFLQMVMAAPLRRAMGLGSPMTPAERQDWVLSTVRLFLDGCRGVARPVR